MDNKKLRSNIILAVILNIVGITLTALMIGYVKTYVYSLIFAAIAVLDVLYAVGLSKNVEWLYKFVLTCYYIGVVVLALMLTVVRTGLINQFYNEQGELDSGRIADALRGKKSAVVIFIVLSFLQVTFLPVPSIVLTVAGAAVFGIGAGMVYSLIGQVAGSMVAFWLGKIFGKKLIIWMVGKDAFDKYNKIISGRDKIVIMFMLLFPFFPDDLLCMFAGLTTFSGLTFFIVILISRIITISYTSFGYGVLDTIKNLGAWSYVIYIVFALIVIAVFWYVWKHGASMEAKMLALIDKITPSRLKKKRAAEIASGSISDDNTESVNSADLPFSDDEDIKVPPAEKETIEQPSETTDETPNEKAPD